MSVIRAGDVRRFVATGCRDTPIILVFGPDEGSVRVRTRDIRNTILGAKADDLARVDFDAESINADPVRLLDEANAIGLFGDKRVITVANAGKLRKDAWQPLLEAPPLGATVLLLADDLGKSSPLRVAVEKSADAAAIACYAPSHQDILELIDARIRESGLTITPTARSYLAELLGSDLALSENEIDKLILYSQDRLVVDVADIDALITDSSSLTGTDPVDLAFEGKLEEIEHVALRSFREGINPSGLILLAINHAMLLKKLVNNSHDSLDTALKSEGVFFRRIDRVRAQIGRWDAATLNRAIETLANAQFQSRKAPALEEIIVVRALWSLALASRRR
ncbi:MAG TPA: DNA polymerase III subunit delta [Rhabdaerophilum sp.]|nr:DNA polymerase III subunit delta [Rhabdaerophilum sp.]